MLKRRAVNGVLQQETPPFRSKRGKRRFKIEETGNRGGLDDDYSFFK